MHTKPRHAGVKSNEAQEAYQGPPTSPPEYHACIPPKLNTALAQSHRNVFRLSPRVAQWDLLFLMASSPGASH